MNDRDLVRDWWTATLALALLAAGLLWAANARAYSDATADVHVQTSCPADGLCRPELFVNRADPASPASVRVDYDDEDPLRWTVTIRNVRLLVADGAENYDQRTCATFFDECPGTLHLEWLQNQDRMVVVLDTDSDAEVRLANVPKPESVTVDGVPTSAWEYYGTGGRLWDLRAGVREIVLCMRGCGPSGGFDAFTECSYDSFSGEVACRSPGTFGEVCYFSAGATRCASDGATARIPVAGPFDLADARYEVEAWSSAAPDLRDSSIVYADNLPRRMLALSLVAAACLGALLLARRKRRRRPRRSA